MYHFCTIGSGNYLPFIETLFHSLRRQDENVVLHALLTDGTMPPAKNENLRFYSIDQLLEEPYVREIVDKYGYRNDYMRWALKPVLLLYIYKKYGKVIYVDNDIYFFKKFDFLFTELDRCSVILTPHWCSFLPLPNEENFKTNFQIGLFNAGFVGASEQSADILTWWTKACLYKMERNDKEGLFDDQRYLDLVPIIDENACILRHRGCNLGSWNMHQNKRTLVNNEVMINGTYPVVFVHFNHDTIWHILNGNDHLLQPYFAEYEKSFATTGNDLQTYIKSLKDWKDLDIVHKLKHKTLIRTRLKNWLFRLSQKL